MQDSTIDQLQGMAHKLKGSVKEAVGHLTNNPDLEAEGRIEKIGGHVQEKVGQVEKVLDK